MEEIGEITLGDGAQEEERRFGKIIMKNWVGGRHLSQLCHAMRVSVKRQACHTMSNGVTTTRTGPLKPSTLARRAHDGLRGRFGHAEKSGVTE